MKKLKKFIKKKEIAKFYRILLLESSCDIMPKIDNSLINDIRNKVDIVEVISSYLKLETRGKNYFGNCPFHDDHSPSMSVSKDKQIYTCFSCGATGNVFKFIQDFEHISFIDAVKKCADMCGIELNISSSKSDNYISKHKELYDIYATSQKFYQNNINSSLGKSAKEYLYSRKISDEEIKKFDIGLSLNEHDMLTKLLLKKDFKEKDLIKSGLVNDKDSKLYDVYKNRIMFPLHDTNGYVIGYNGRAYQGEITNKYVNSKETDIFKKRDYLYNYHRAKQPSKDKNQIIVMEGPMDVIRASCIGVDNVVATLGTSFSSSHANLIRRLSSNVILCFDGDDAGLKGTKLAINELQKIGINPKIVRIPNGQDPDEFIKEHGKDSFDNLLSNAYNVMDFKEILLKKDINFQSTADISKYVKSMIEEINKIDDDILRDLTINKLCDETKISKDIILSKLKDKSNNQFIMPKRKSLSTDKYTKSVEALLYYMLKSPEVIELYDEKITHIENDEYRHLGFQISAFYKQNSYIDVADFITSVNDDEETVKTVGKIVSLNLKDDYNLQEIEDYLENIREFNDVKKIDKYKVELSMSNSLDEKLALANKLIEYKLRSEKND